MHFVIGHEGPAVAFFGTCMSPASLAIEHGTGSEAGASSGHPLRRGQDLLSVLHRDGRRRQAPLGFFGEFALAALVVDGGRE